MLDAGPMRGFDPVKLNEAFFPDGRWKARFLVKLCKGDAAGKHPRGTGLAFDEVARIASGAEQATRPIVSSRCAESAVQRWPRS